MQKLNVFCGILYVVCFFFWEKKNIWCKTLHLCNQDLDSIIPDEIELCHVLRISSKTYYQIKNTQQTEWNDENHLKSETKVWYLPIVTKEEQVLLFQFEIQQQICDCFRPRQVRNWIENYIKERERTVEIDPQASSISQ